MILMSSLPSSWETFVTTVCNASTTAIKYSEVTSAILTEAAQRKSFIKDSAEEAYVVEGSCVIVMARTTWSPQEGQHHAPIQSRIHPQTLLL